MQSSTSENIMIKIDKRKVSSITMKSYVPHPRTIMPYKSTIIRGSKTRTISKIEKINTNLRTDLILLNEAENSSKPKNLE